MDNIGKKLPYIESQQYLDNLIEQATEQAIKHQANARRCKHWGMMIASAAAVMLLLVGISITVMRHENPQPTTILQTEGPLDEFLNTLTDEEAAQLQYYEIEEIPEY